MNNHQRGAARRAGRPAGYADGGEVRGGRGDDDFKSWYAGHAKRNGLNADPDHPDHHYDYRAAHAAGAEPGPDGHWPSQFKTEGHPRTYVNTDTDESSATPRPGMIDTRAHQ